MGLGSHTEPPAPGCVGGQHIDLVGPRPITAQLYFNPAGLKLAPIHPYYSSNRAWITQKHPWGEFISVQRKLGMPPFRSKGTICLPQYDHQSPQYYYSLNSIHSSVTSPSATLFCRFGESIIYVGDRCMSLLRSRPPRNPTFWTSPAGHRIMATGTLMCAGVHISLNPLRFRY